MFTRKIYEYLLEWKRRDSGRTAALIEGPRRVGKSTVAKASHKTSIAPTSL